MEFKPIKIRMKYDSLDLIAGDELYAKSDAELRNLTGRGGQIVDEKPEVKKEEKKPKKEARAPKKEKKEEAKEQKVEDNKEEKKSKKEE